MAIDPVLKDRWLREFGLHGFVILRGFLPTSRLEALREQMLPIPPGERNQGDRGAPNLSDAARAMLDQTSREAKVGTA